MDDIRLPPGPARYLQALADLSEERHAEVEQADIAERARLAPDAAQEAGTFLEESGLITRRVGDLTGRSTILARPTLARLSTLKAGVGASQSQVPSEHAPTPGAELKRLRERLCWTQFELAARVNLHESSVARHERDEVIISGQNARAYAECFSRELEEQIRPAMFRPQESQKSP
ncbi:MAG: helix-turn-helix transcriptional regulator [Acidobacteria bacterium]|nr:helix-turn-helix transcriptional regulator [Acidobacteriota bacterium]